MQMAIRVLVLCPESDSLKERYRESSQVFLLKLRAGIDRQGSNDSNSTQSQLNFIRRVHSYISNV